MHWRRVRWRVLRRQRWVRVLSHVLLVFGGTVLPQILINVLSALLQQWLGGAMPRFVRQQMKRARQRQRARLWQRYHTRARRRCAPWRVPRR